MWQITTLNIWNNTYNFNINETHKSKFHRYCTKHQSIPTKHPMGFPPEICGINAITKSSGIIGHDSLGTAGTGYQKAASINHIARWLRCHQSAADAHWKHNKPWLNRGSWTFPFWPSSPFQRRRQAAGEGGKFENDRRWPDWRWKIGKCGGRVARICLSHNRWWVCVLLYLKLNELWCIALAKIYVSIWWTWKYWVDGCVV